MIHAILIAGLILVFCGTETALRGAVGLARQFDLPPLYTGIFVIGILTVMPELFVTWRAATAGHPDLALGGLIGANLLNLLLIMGLGALIHPMASPPKVVFRDGGALVLGAAALAILALAGGLTPMAGAGLLLGYAAYLGLVMFTDWRRAPDHSVPLARALLRSEGEMPSLAAAFFAFAAGLIMLGLGTHFVVLGGVHLASELGFSEATVGLTLIALSLSSPKLLVTLVAAVRGQTSVAVGQLLGASAANLTLVLGLIALISPFAMPEIFRAGDIYILLAVSVILLPLLAMRWRLSRPRGALLILAYGCYLGYLLVRQGTPLPWGSWF